MDNKTNNEVKKQPFAKVSETVQTVGLGIAIVATSSIACLVTAQIVRHAHILYKAHKEKKADGITYIGTKDGVFLFDADNNHKTAEVIATADNEKSKAENIGLLYGHEGEKRSIAKWKGMTTTLQFTVLNNQKMNTKE